ncbi:hypothetical protein PH210_06155 [Paenibacillus sp. BSR1-1]|uniref:hypothetical protein n=1 Tax=Paenibacillus sp. BSR1-1 TaxID=3020845 RepID=UPI0025B26122|nr:hypothetical protein [Paenibacillus sp. BSR1-1]MDN3015788.1 hypothetical protein [Paenibacillus sp. BSR1-1]
MDDSKGIFDLHFHNTVLQVYKPHRRIGFREAKIEISHCLLDKEPGYDFTLYDEVYGYNVDLFSLKEKDSQKFNLHSIAIRLAEAIKEKTGLDIQVIKKIQGTPMEYDENAEAFAEKMWIARMALEGIDDDY